MSNHKAGKQIVPVAERILQRIAEQYLGGLAMWDGKGPIPEALDQLSFAGALVSNEAATNLGPKPPASLLACEDAAAKSGRQAAINTMPWKIALDHWRPGYDTVYSELAPNLGHDASGLRCHFLELGWIVRNRLDRDEALPQLFKNVATAIMGVDMSIALGASFFDTPEEFFACADAHVPPPDYRDQYLQRIEEARGPGFWAMGHEFWLIESAIRKRICDAAFDLSEDPRDDGIQLHLELFN